MITGGVRTTSFLFDPDYLGSYSHDSDVLLPRLAHMA